MSFPTKPAYIINCAGWEEKFKEHPIWAWMIAHEIAFDTGNAKNEAYNIWCTDDILFVDGTGKSSQGIQAWDNLIANYAPLAKHFHEPFFGMIYENDDGNYELFGNARIFANMLVPGEGKKVKDLQGREWDLMVPGAFHFTYVKDKTGPLGYKMKIWKLYADGVPMVGKLLERGMVTPEDLMKKMAA